jgi:hypothetical protein
MQCVTSMLVGAMLLATAAVPTVAQNAPADDRVRFSQESTSPRPGLRKRIAGRLDRRQQCRQQARDRGLTARMARRFTRLCLSGAPIPTRVP